MIDPAFCLTSQLLRVPARQPRRAHPGGSSWSGHPMLSKCPQALPQGCSARAGGTDCAPLRPHPGGCSQTPRKHPKGAGVTQSHREDSGSGPAASRRAAMSTAQGWFPPRSGVGVPALQPRKPRCHVTPQLLGEPGLLGLRGTRDSHPTAVHSLKHTLTRTDTPPCTDVRSLLH